MLIICPLSLFGGILLLVFEHSFCGFKDQLAGHIHLYGAGQQIVQNCVVGMEEQQADLDYCKAQQDDGTQHTGDAHDHHKQNKHRYHDLDGTFSEDAANEHGEIVDHDAVLTHKCDAENLFAQSLAVFQKNRHQKL